jgi:hypothetical protein
METWIKGGTMNYRFIAAMLVNFVCLWFLIIFIGYHYANHEHCVPLNVPNYDDQMQSLFSEIQKTVIKVNDASEDAELCLKLTGNLQHDIEVWNDKMMLALKQLVQDVAKAQKTADEALKVSKKKEVWQCR